MLPAQRNACRPDFGASVAIDGNNVVIGNPAEEPFGKNAGRAFLFDAVTGNLLHTFNDPNPAAGDNFGDTVAISGDNVVIGVPRDDTNGDLAGQAFLFDAVTGNP